MTHGKRRRFWLKLAAGLLFAVLAYGGAYFATVYRILVGVPQNLGGFQFESGPYEAVPGYAIPLPHALAIGVFTPAHFIDRRIRPDAWKPQREMRWSDLVATRRATRIRNWNPFR